MEDSLFDKYDNIDIDALAEQNAGLKEILKYGTPNYFTSREVREQAGQTNIFDAPAVEIVRKMLEAEEAEARTKILLPEVKTAGADATRAVLAWKGLGISAELAERDELADDAAVRDLYESENLQPLNMSEESAENLRRILEQTGTDYAVSEIDGRYGVVIQAQTATMLEAAADRLSECLSDIKIAGAAVGKTILHKDLSVEAAQQRGDESAQLLTAQSRVISLDEDFDSENLLSLFNAAPPQIEVNPPSGFEETAEEETGLETSDGQIKTGEEAGIETPNAENEPVLPQQPSADSVFAGTNRADDEPQQPAAVEPAEPAELVAENPLRPLRVLDNLGYFTKILSGSAFDFPYEATDEQLRILQKPTREIRREDLARFANIDIDRFAEQDSVLKKLLQYGTPNHFEKVRRPGDDFIQGNAMDLLAEQRIDYLIEHAETAGIDIPDIKTEKISMSEEDKFISLLRSFMEPWTEAYDLIFRNSLREDGKSAQQAESASVSPANEEIRAAESGEDTRIEEESKITEQKERNYDSSGEERILDQSAAEDSRRLDEGGDGGNQTVQSDAQKREADFQERGDRVEAGAADLASGQSSSAGVSDVSRQYSGFAFEDDKADGGEGVRRDGDAAGEGVGSDGFDRPGRLDSRGVSYGAVQAAGAGDGDERSYSEIVAGIESQAAVSPFERAEKNIEALKVLFALRIQNGDDAFSYRPPSDGQLQILQQYSGWGGAAKAFSDDPEWAGIRSRLLDLLSDEEFAQARSSVLTAYYTPVSVVQTVWDSLEKHGLTSGKNPAKVLELGCGTGNFVSLKPGNTHVSGVEIDPVSAQIAQILNPDANIVNKDIRDCFISEDAWSAVVGNVPYDSGTFGEYKTLSGEKINLPVHGWFAAKAVNSLAPGGFAMILASTSVLDSSSGEALRQDLDRKAELVSAVRLPQGVFGRQAGTQVSCDVLVFKKRDKPVAEKNYVPSEWTFSMPLRLRDFSDDKPVRINKCFVPFIPQDQIIIADDDPVFEQSDPRFAVAGSMSASSGQYGPVIGVKTAADPEQTAAQTLSAVLDSALAGVESVPDSKAKPATDAPVCAVAHTGGVTQNYFIDDNGRVWFGNSDGYRAVTFKQKTGQRLERLKALIGIADTVKTLRSMEITAESSDADIEAQRKLLNEQYESFVSRFGRISSRANKNLYNPAAADRYIIDSLEETDERGRFSKVKDIFIKRTMFPAPPEPVSADNPRDALNIVLSSEGKVNMSRIASLLNVEEKDARLLLREQIISDPQTGKDVLADDYLSGDVVGKLDFVRSRIDELKNAGRAENLKEWRQSFRHVGDPDWKNMCFNGSECFSPRSEKDIFSGSMLSLVRPYESDEPLPPLSSVFPLDKEKCFPVLKTVFEYGDANVFADRREYESGVACYLNPFLDRFASDALKITADSSAGWQTGFDVVKDLMISLADRKETVGKQYLTDVFAAFTRDWRNNGSGKPSARWIQNAYRLTGSQTPEELADRFEPVLAEYLFSASDASFAEFEQFRAQREEFFSSRMQPADTEEISRLEQLAARLENARPVLLAASEIEANPGAGWIPVKIYNDFLRERLGDPYAGTLYNSDWHDAYCYVSRLPSGALFVNNAGRQVTTGLTAADEKMFSFEKYSPVKIFETVINGEQIIIPKNSDAQDAHAEAEQRSERQMRVNSAIDNLTEAWHEWIWADERRAKVLVQAYNDRMNNLAVKKIDTSYVTLIGAAEEIKTPTGNVPLELRENQKTALARILRSETGTLVAHGVGTGKTLTGCAAVHDAKRLGRASKPMIVVPNQIVRQWADYYQSIYPNDRVLVFEASSRQQAEEMWASVMFNDWDAVIVPFSRFDQLDVSEETRERYVKERLDELRQSNADAVLRYGNNSKSVKDLERAAKQFEKLLEKYANQKNVASGDINFEKLGVDMLFVDEAHSYKNLASASAQTSSVMSAGSGKSERMLRKVRYLSDIGKAGNVVFATGTPVTNNIGEMYNMQQYLAPELLKSQQVATLSSWIPSFAKVGNVIDYDPFSADGSGQPKKRFEHFNNIPELMKMYQQFADVVPVKDAQLPDIPGVERIQVVAERTAEQNAHMQQLVERASSVRSVKAVSGADNMLKITSEGRLLSVDPMLIAENADQAPQAGGKVQACAQNLGQIWLDTENASTYETSDGQKWELVGKGTQIVFCDTGVPSAEKQKTGRPNIYDDLKRRTVEYVENVSPGRGEEIASQIEFVHDWETKREKLFERVRNGETRIIVGSTQKMGTGVNMQDRVAAVHDLDVPWRPADREQRDARGLRQGNRNSGVRIYSYVSKGTLDDWSYGILAKKAKFISDITDPKNTQRVIKNVNEDVIDYNTLAAAASQNPLMQQYAKLENEYFKLKNAYSAHLEIRREAQNEMRQLEQECEKLKTSLIPRAQKNHETFERLDAAIAADAQAGRFSGMTVNGVFCDSKKQAGSALISASLSRNMSLPEPFEAGQYKNCGIILKNFGAGDRRIGLKVNGDAYFSQTPLPSEAKSFIVPINQLHAAVKDAAGDKTRFEARLKDNQTRIGQLKELAGRPFEQFEEYKLKEQTLNKIKNSLNPDSQPAAKQKPAASLAAPQAAAAEI